MTTELTKGEAAVKGYFRLRKEAVRDPAVFFSFVMRDARNPMRRIRCAAHQAFGFEFAEHHPVCVFRWPTDSGKTLFTVAYSLFLVGHDPSAVCLFLSDIGDIAARQILMLRAYLDPASPLNSRVQSVFPGLQLSPLEEEAKTTKKLTVARERGGADPTFIALGMDSNVNAKKPRYIFADDMLSAKNSRTPETRHEVLTKFQEGAIGRLPAEGSRVIVCNVPWDRQDLTYALEAGTPDSPGWPTVEMDIYGNVRIENAAPDFDSDLIRPGRRGGQWHRLTAFDPDPDEESVLFPEEWPKDKIALVRYGNPATGEPPKYTSRVFAQQKLCQPSSAEDERCPLEWWQRCHVRGMSRENELRSENPIFTGFDLGWGKKKSSGKTTQFTFERESDTSRRILWVESWTAMTGPALVRKLYEVIERYGGWIGVESVAAQKYILDFANDDDARLDEKIRRMLRARILPYGTGAEKHNPIFGIESLFGEVEQMQWRVPCTVDGLLHPEIEELEQEARSYNPLGHSGDRLMAWFVARQTERRIGPSGRSSRSGGAREMARQARQTLDAPRGGGRSADLVSALIARQYPTVGGRRF